MKDLRKLATEILESVRDELLKQTHPMKHTNGYPSYAIPKGTIIDMIPLCRKIVESKLLSFHEQASKDMVDLKFVEWACFEDSGFEITFNQATNEHGFYSEKLHVFYSLSELYQYYKNNIQGK